MKKVVLNYFGVFCVLFQLFGASAQSGCTDPQAQNYDLNALVNDGLCEYSVTSYSMQLIANLTGELDENSGLIYSNNRIFSINDGGNGTQIQELSFQGNILRTIHVDSNQNTDWEAVSQSNSQVYIGDFGNNGGNRTNLKILKIAKNELQNFDTVQASALHFQYSDQVSFNNIVNQHNFDCEAFFFFQDSLHLFTKGWENLYTKHYVIPLNNQDSVQAQLRDSLFVNGLITDATIDTTTGRILLLGYKNNGSNFYTSFIYLLFDYNPPHFFSGNKRRIEIGNMFNVSQTEGIALENAASGFISAERITSSLLTVSPKLFHFDFTSYFENPTSSVQNNSELVLSVYPNPAQEFIQIFLPNDIQQFSMRIKDKLNRVIIEKKLALTKEKINIEQLKPGTYLVEVISNQKINVIPFVKN
jgi:hypothetical protein